MRVSNLARGTVIPALAMLLLFGATALWWPRRAARDQPVGMAVEFLNHAAAAYVAHEQGWYEARGLRLSTYQSYATGMALASAMARQEVQVAYLCLVPAVNAYANAKIPLKIVAGTHTYGYGLVVNPGVVGRVEDLLGEEVRLGCVREGGAVDVLLNRTLDHYHLDRESILPRVRRMSPPQLLLALKAGQLDAAFLPEQWASMAEDFGFRMLLGAQEIWPGMPGSVLVVKDELLRATPEVVEKLVEVNREATEWINEHPRQAALMLARVLSVKGADVVAPPSREQSLTPDIHPDLMERSMKRLSYSTAISVSSVQEVIDYLAQLGYIAGRFPAEDILDTRFLR